MKSRRHKSYAAAGTIAGGAGKGKTWDEEEDQKLPNSAGMDELLEVLGYKVKSSDMAQVAQKLERLEMMMGSAQAEEDGASISHLAAGDTVHYNPSDLSGWVHTMLSELDLPDSPTGFNIDPPPPVVIQDPPSLMGQIDDPVQSGGESSSSSVKLNYYGEDRVSDQPYDLSAIPGDAIYKNWREIDSGGDCSFPNKRMRTSVGSDSCKSFQISSSSDPSPALELERPVMVVDSQETGVRLVHTLLACAEAVQQGDLNLAGVLVKHVGILAPSQTGAMRKVAAYFAEALARRIYGIIPRESPIDCSVLRMHFYEACPYLKFAHFTANQAILEAVSGAGKIHVVDFSLGEGMQWPALMQALALRPGGSPSFRLTGISTSDEGMQPQQVGWKLNQLAQTVGVEFEFKGLRVDSLADLAPSMLEIRDKEAVAVNSVFELHRLLASPAALERALAGVRAAKPRILAVVEQEVNHNGPVFLDRFTEALHYYSALFDSLEGSGSGQTDPGDLLISEMYLGRQICNVVACEAADRVERHEPLARWRVRFESAGFIPVHLGSNAFKQASMLLSVFAGGEGYAVEEKDGSLMLGWHTRPLIATSAWKLAGAGQTSQLG